MPVRENVYICAKNTYNVLNYTIIRMNSKTYNSKVRGVTPFVRMDRNKNPLSVLIIGNGFDLDLGMHTSYRDFAKSKLWPFDSPIYDKGLGYYLNQKKHTENWFDLERELANYALSLKETSLEDKTQIKNDKEDFSVLIQKLKEFLKTEQDNLYNVEDDVAAKRVLRDLIKLPNYFIHSFNYTDISSIAKKLGISQTQSRVEYVHGALANNDIILGTGDNTGLPEEYDFLYKTSNKNYSSNNLAESLDYAQEIIIFGHSLGENDFDYFKPFFQKISQNVGVNYNSIENKRLELTIYTKDEKSEIAIKRQLRKLTDNHLQGIYANCDFKIEYTKP